MTAAAAARVPKKRRIPAWLEFIVLLVVAVTVAVVIKSFFVQMFFVPSSSMRPLFIADDRILVQKLSYWNGDVQRGDVIVFDDPGGQWLGEPPVRLNVVQQALSSVGLYPSGGHLVKRVIGVGGDHVVCCDAQGRIRVNDVPLEERSYIRRGTTPSEMEFDVVVPKQRLWVMGDNRTNSEDSRFHQNLPGRGTVPVDDVVGKVYAIVWPAGRIDRLQTPTTFKNIRLELSKPSADQPP